jgi:hypothetical protein
VVFVACLPLTIASAEDPAKKAAGKTPRSSESTKTSVATQDQEDRDMPEFDLLDAMAKGAVSAKAEGSGDGRMIVSVTNRTKSRLRVVLPPGIIAQGTTGQMGGMGGMGGGGMGGGMGGMGGGMGGGGMGGGGGMRGMGGMGRSSGTMPPMMGLMTLSRIIMYFCGDYSGWDQRSLMIGMGGMRGGMGGMGGGMMGGMGGGMRSVPPTGLPFAELKPGQSRQLPTRLVSLTSPDLQVGLKFPQKGEPLHLGDISEMSDDPRVRKALKRLAADKAPTRVSQLVMWHIAAGLDWETIGQLSQDWANRYELTMARDFVEHLDTMADGESGRIQFLIGSAEASNEAIAAEVSRALQGKIVLGLRAEQGIPIRPEGPSVGVRVRLKGKDAQVQVTSSDASARNWVTIGKYTLGLNGADGKFDAVQFTDALAEGLLNRLVRVQLVKGPRDKDRPTFGLRIDNASPLNLNGLAALGLESQKGQAPRVLSGVSIPPRRSMTVSASEDVVKQLGLKHGIRIVAIDLSGL